MWKRCVVPSGPYLRFQYYYYRRFSPPKRNGETAERKRHRVDKKNGQRRLHRRRPRWRRRLRLRWMWKKEESTRTSTERMNAGERERESEKQSENGRNGNNKKKCGKNGNNHPASRHMSQSTFAQGRFNVWQNIFVLYWPIDSRKIHFSLFLSVLVHSVRTRVLFSASFVCLCVCVCV